MRQAAKKNNGNIAVAVATQLIVYKNSNYDDDCFNKPFFSHVPL